MTETEHQKSLWRAEVEARANCRETWARMPHDAQSVMTLLCTIDTTRITAAIASETLDDDGLAQWQLAYVGGWLQQAGTMASDYAHEVARLAAESIARRAELAAKG